MVLEDHLADALRVLIATRLSLPLASAVDTSRKFFQKKKNESDIQINICIQMKDCSVFI